MDREDTDFVQSDLRPLPGGTYRHFVILTQLHVCLMEFPTLINRISPFPFLVFSAILIQILSDVLQVKSADPDQITRSVASDLVWSHKQNASLKWVNGQWIPMVFCLVRMDWLSARAFQR